MTKRFISHDDAKPGTGLPDIVETALNATYVEVREGLYSVTREDDVDPTGATDSTAGILAAATRLPPGGGGGLRFPPGLYRHDGVTFSGLTDVELAFDGAAMRTNVETRPYVEIVDCENVRVRGLSTGNPDATARRAAPTRGLSLLRTRNFLLDRVHVVGGEGVGIYMEDCHDGVIMNPIVEDVLADGIHGTHECTNITVVNPITRRTGDDGIAFVSYDKPVPWLGRNAEQCRDITVIAPQVRDSGSRGIACVGSKRMHVLGGDVHASRRAGLHIAYEATYETHTPSRVRVTGTNFWGCNHDTTSTMGVVHLAATSNMVSRVDRINLNGITIEGGTGPGIMANAQRVSARGFDISGTRHGVLSNYGRHQSYTDFRIEDVEQYGLKFEEATTGRLRVTNGEVAGANLGTVAGVDGVHALGNYSDGGGIIDQILISDPGSRLEQGIQANGTNVLVGMGNHLNGRPMTFPTAKPEVRSGVRLRVDGGFAVNKWPPTTTPALPTAASDSATTQALANAVRSALIAAGLAQ